MTLRPIKKVEKMITNANDIRDLDKALALVYNDLMGMKYTHKYGAPRDDEEAYYDMLDFLEWDDTLRTLLQYDTIIRELARNWEGYETSGFYQEDMDRAELVDKVRERLYTVDKERLNESSRI